MFFRATRGFLHSLAPAASSVLLRMSGRQAALKLWTSSQPSPRVFLQGHQGRSDSTHAQDRESPHPSFWRPGRLTASPWSQLSSVRPLVSVWSPLFSGGPLFPPPRGQGLSDQSCKGLQPGDSNLPVTERLEQRPNGHLKPTGQYNYKEAGSDFEAWSELMG